MVYKFNYPVLRERFSTQLDLANAKRHITGQNEFAEYVAYLYWGAADLWPVIALVNNLDTPQRIPVGRELVIPTYAQAYAEYTRIYLEYR